MTLDQLPSGNRIELITEVPTSVLQALAERASNLQALDSHAVVTEVPGHEGESGYRSPEDAVAAIQKQLAERPQGAGRPEVRAGGTDGLITQRGE
jgi:hypothetical protein